MGSCLHDNNTFRNSDIISAWESYTKCLSDTSTDPSLWCDRALINLELSIHELSYVDALRANFLITSTIDNSLNSIIDDNLGFSCHPSPSISQSTHLSLDSNLQDLLVKSYDLVSESLHRLGLISRAVSVLDHLLNHQKYGKCLTHNLRNELMNKRNEYQEKLKERLIYCISYVSKIFNNPNVRNFKKAEVIELIKNMGTCKFEYPWDKRRSENRISDERIRILQQKLDVFASKGVRVERIYKWEESTPRTIGEDPSIHLGIFAQEEIPEDSVIWSEDP
ncbi:5371_t:CDS:1, partial [Acaulospora morrowiae]